MRKVKETNYRFNRLKAKLVMAYLVENDVTFFAMPDGEQHFQVTVDVKTEHVVDTYLNTLNRQKEKGDVKENITQRNSNHAQLAQCG